MLIKLELWKAPIVQTCASTQTPCRRPVLALVIFISSLGSASTYQMVYVVRDYIYSHVQLLIYHPSLWNFIAEGRSDRNDYRPVFIAWMTSWLQIIEWYGLRNPLYTHTHCKSHSSCSMQAALLTKCLGLMQRKIEGHRRGSLHAKGPKQHTSDILPQPVWVEGSGCRLALISTFYRVVSLPRVTPVR